MKNTLLSFSATLAISGVACLAILFHDIGTSKFNNSKKLSLSNTTIYHLVMGGLLLPHLAVCPLIIASKVGDWAPSQIWTPGLPWAGFFYWQIVANSCVIVVLTGTQRVIARDLSGNTMSKLCPVATDPSPTKRLVQVHWCVGQWDWGNPCHKDATHCNNEKCR